MSIVGPDFGVEWRGKNAISWQSCSICKQLWTHISIPHTLSVVCPKLYFIHVVVLAHCLFLSFVLTSPVPAVNDSYITSGMSLGFLQTKNKLYVSQDTLWIYRRRQFDSVGEIATLFPRKEFGIKNRWGNQSSKDQDRASVKTKRIGAGMKTACELHVTPHPHIHTLKISKQPQRRVNRSSLWAFDMCIVSRHSHQANAVRLLIDLCIRFKMRFLLSNASILARNFR